MLSEDFLALSNFSGIARLFPLPKLVYFPFVELRLHIFEPRYRQMTADALTGDHLIAMVLLTERPSASAVEGYEFVREEVACLGRIVAHEQLEDGRYNLRLRGLGRLRLHAEVPAPDKLYIQTRAQLVGEIVPALPAKAIQLRKSLRQAVLNRFEPSGSTYQQLEDLFESDMTLGQVCDLLSYSLPFPPEFKQQLLAEPDVALRAEALVDFLIVPAIQRKFPPDFSSN